MKSPIIPSVLASTDYPVQKNCQFAAQFMNLIIEIEFDALKPRGLNWNVFKSEIRRTLTKEFRGDSIVGETSDLSAFQTVLIFLSKTITYGEGLSNAFCYCQKKVSLIFQMFVINTVCGRSSWNKGDLKSKSFSFCPLRYSFNEWIVALNYNRFNVNANSNCIWANWMLWMKWTQVLQN